MTQKEGRTRTKLIVLAAVAGLVAIVVNELPAIRRELKILRM